MPLIQIATPFSIDLEFEISEFHKRLFAYLIDFTLLLIFFISMKYFYYGRFGRVSTNILERNMGLDILTISIPMLLYSLITEIVMHGQTVGKKLINIRVIGLDGGEPTLSQYIIRWMFKAFEWPFFFGYTVFTGESLFGYVLITGFLGIGVVIFIAVTKKNQRLGDIAANTVVVNTQSPFSVDDTVFREIRVENYVVKYPEVLKLSDRDVNTIKNVINVFYKNNNTEICARLSLKIQEVLNINTDMYPIDFLEKLLADYNYLAIR
ncbi:MAG: RDD family protein [Bacteroidota bacterium]|nr:RDD family protein [Bacteroidota bacterium]